MIYLQIESTVLCYLSNSFQVFFCQICILLLFIFTLYILSNILYHCIKYFVLFCLTPTLCTSILQCTSEIIKINFCRQSQLYSDCSDDCSWTHCQHTNIQEMFQKNSLCFMRTLISFPNFCKAGPQYGSVRTCLVQSCLAWFYSLRIVQSRFYVRSPVSSGSIMCVLSGSILCDPVPSGSILCVLSCLVLISLVLFSLILF